MQSWTKETLQTWTKRNKETVFLHASTFFSWLKHLEWLKLKYLHSMVQIKRKIWIKYSWHRLGIYWFQDSNFAAVWKLWASLAAWPNFSGKAIFVHYLKTQSCKKIRQISESKYLFYIKVFGIIEAGWDKLCAYSFSWEFGFYGKGKYLCKVFPDHM